MSGKIIWPWFISLVPSLPFDLPEFSDKLLMKKDRIQKLVVDLRTYLGGRPLLLELLSRRRRQLIIEDLDGSAEPSGKKSEVYDF